MHGVKVALIGVKVTPVSECTGVKAHHPSWCQIDSSLLPPHLGPLTAALLHYATLGPRAWINLVKD
jgi:hypothetical protein